MGKVIKSKRPYSQPTLMVEEFISDVYCAACYSLACTHGINGAYDENADKNSRYYEYQKHSKNSNGTGCGHAANQRFRIDDSGKMTVVELNAPNTNPGEELPCTFTGDIPTSATGPFTVKWTTYHPGIRFTYTHEGTINLTNSNKNGNHS